MENPIDATRLMTVLGKIYERLYRIPVAGETLVRGINRGIARASFNSPVVRRKRHTDIQSLKADFLRLLDMMKIPVEIIEGSEGPERFEFYVLGCPYGFHRADQQGVCDAAMDMDRLLFRLMGAELTVQEAVVQGFPRCRILMRLV